MILNPVCNFWNSYWYTSYDNKGFKNDEAKQVVDLICDAIENKENSDELGIVKDKGKGVMQ